MRSERATVFLVGAVQFVNILDFMMVMPLGPDFSKALDIPVSHLGYISGSYTAAAAIAGIIGSFFLDRFDRRNALAVALLGLVIGTAMGGFATGLTTLMAARIIAGAFGGPATSIALSIIADVIPPERRGKALGAVMGSFSLASVLGVPAGLELARQGGWKMPFFAVAGLGLLIGASAIFLLPPLKIHLEAKNKPTKNTSIADLFSRPIVVLSYLMTACVMGGMFVLIPNLSAYIQQNLGYPRAQIGILYLVGGSVSFFTMRTTGMLVDKLSPLSVGTIGVFMLVSITWAGFYLPAPLLPVMAVFVLFMISTGVRGVPYNTLVSRVPLPHERARFMSIQSAVQHIASAVGGFLAAAMLTESADGMLQGMPNVALLSMLLALAQPPLFWIVQRMILRRDAAVPVAPPAPALAE